MNVLRHVNLARIFIRPFHFETGVALNTRNLSSTLDIRTMKRKAVDIKDAPESKRQKDPISEYCDEPPQKDDDGAIVWPASPTAMEKARGFLKEW